MKRILIICILVLSLLMSGCGTKLTGRAISEDAGGYDSLAQCLTEKGVKMYGTEWCSHCQNQKKLFGDSFRHIDYIDCDKYRDECIQTGVRGYPTWVINGNSYPGEQSLNRLAILSDCSID